MDVNTSLLDSIHRHSQGLKATKESKPVAILKNYVMRAQKMAMKLVATTSKN
jgi:hypothetical protein